jgi:hypothetical protein
MFYGRVNNSRNCSAAPPRQNSGPLDPRDGTRALNGALGSGQLLLIKELTHNEV